MDVATFDSHRRTVSTGAGEIAYTEFGEGPPAVFVHGIGMSGLLWRNAMENLAGTSRCIAMDLPLHGRTPGREDLSAAAMAEMIADLCGSLGLGQVDLVGNDSGGAIAQIFAARHPELLRSLVLTNCDTDGNFPPQEFIPLFEMATRGELAPVVATMAADPSTWRTSPIADGYENPGLIPDEVWRAYVTPIGATIERAREFERLLASLDPGELSAVSGALQTLDVPTLLVWGPGYEPFGIKWAYRLREMMPAVREVIEVDGAKLYFPEERPADLVPHLRRHWAR
jgi:pimeloyl-ACP methyl ester carboxylesterase